MNKKIIIIGAGASGVATATKLVSNGFKDVIILEAGNRIGGRINTIPFGDNVLDMGAQWCHGEKNNVVYEMAKDKGFLGRSETKNGTDSPNIIRSNGEEIPMEISAKFFEYALSVCEGDIFEEEAKGYKGSVGNFFAGKFKEALKTDMFKDVKPEWVHELYETAHKMMKNLDGCDSWYEESTVTEYEACEGDFELNWKDKGYITVFELLQLQNKVAGSSEPMIDIIPLIKFNKAVRKIKYNQPDGMIKVECEDDSTFSADHVICTVSLGVLKEKHWNLFEPMIPQEKIDSIDGLQIGTVDKIYLEFEKPFWNNDWNGWIFMWRSEEIKEVLEDPVNGDWLSGLYGFNPVNPLQPNIICGWIVGSAAREMEQKSDADVKAGAERCLRMFLKQYNIPNAKTMIRSKWNSNPHFRGSYSYCTLKAKALDGTPDKLAEPIKDENGKLAIQFAGEATSSKHYSCVHGAIETGWREADRLIELYK